MTDRTREKPVTQTDIARELNISIVSVSNALNGRRGVSNELRQRILDTAQELGYQGNVEKAPKQGRATRIGVLISKRYLLETSSFYMALYQEIVIAATANNCVTYLEVLDIEDERLLKAPDLFGSVRVDGIMIVGELKRPYTKVVKENCEVPVVFLDYYEDIPDTDFIISDGYTGMCRITRKMQKAGYRKIAFVGTIHATSSIMDRYLGYRKALMEHGMEICPEWVIPDRDEDGFNLHVELPEKMPEAFVCNCDKTAYILITELQKAGYRVPEDIGVAGFDHFLTDGAEEIELTTYAVDIVTMARVGVGTLLNRIEHPYFRSRLRVIEGRIIEGSSIAVTQRLL